LVEDAVATAQAGEWDARVTVSLQAARDDRDPAGSPVAARTLAPRGRFVPTASSLSLDAVLDDDEIRSLEEELMKGPVGMVVGGQFPRGAVLDLDQAWFRRQYPVEQAPRFHAPHGWHQDGALGFDFLGVQDAPEKSTGLLDMLTCWIALTPCGDDAPGLELLTAPLDHLLELEALREPVIRAGHSPRDFAVPSLQAGDALLFPGGTLHRTHVLPSMSRLRTSVELRFFPADARPGRLAGDRFHSIPRMT
jgi:hypothetical protein